MRPFWLDRQTKREEETGTYIRRNIDSTCNVFVVSFLEHSDATGTEMFQFTGE